MSFVTRMLIIIAIISYLHVPTNWRRERDLNRRRTSFPRRFSVCGHHQTHTPPDHVTERNRLKAMLHYFSNLYSA
jgi:hypothetical protein